MMRNKSEIYLLILFAIILSGYNWDISASIESGGPGRQMSAVNQDVVYGCADVWLPYKTVDRGTVWKVKKVLGIRETGCYGLIKTGSDLYLGILRTENTSFTYDPIVYRSTDDGESWTVVAESIWPETNSKLDWMDGRFPWAYDANNTVWMSGYNDTFAKIVGGTLTDLSSGIPTAVQYIWDVKIIDRSGTPVVAISTEEGVYRCTANPLVCSASANWSLATGTGTGGGTGIGTIRFMYVDPSNDDIVYLLKRGTSNSQVYKSTDKGATWSTWGNPVGNAQNVPNLIAVNTNGVVCTTEYRQELLNEADGENIFCSPNGTTWTAGTISTANCVQYRCNNLDDGSPWFHPRDLVSAGVDFWLSGEYGFWQSTDGGVNWTLRRSGYYDLPMHDLTCAGGNCWNATYDAQGHKSTSTPDGPWVGINLPSSTDSCDGISDSPDECSGVAAADANTVYYSCAPNDSSKIRIYKTTNAGTSWSNISDVGNCGTTKINLTLPRLAVSPVDSTKLLLGMAKQRDGSSGNVWYSSNSGTTFTSVLSVSKCGKPVFDSTGNAFIICNGDVYKALSTDLTSWSLIYNSALFTSGVFNSVVVDPNNDNNVWANTDNNKILKSENAGGTPWTVKYTAQDGKTQNGVLLVDRADATGNTVYFSWSYDYEKNYAGGLVKTTDGGANWIAYADGLLWPPEGAGKLIYQDPDNGIFTTASIGLYELDTGSVPCAPPPIKKQTQAANATVAPTIDGLTTDQIWSDTISYSINTTVDNQCMVHGTVTNDADLSGTFKVGWDATWLYILVPVTDNSLCQDESGAPDANMSKDDSVEIFIDPENDEGVYATYDRQYSCDKSNNCWSYKEAANPSGATFVSAVATSGSNWTLEMKIAWSLLNKTPAAADKIGFNIQINDDDATCDSIRDGYEIYNGDGTNYLTMDQAGECELLSGPTGGGETASTTKR